MRIFLLISILGIGLFNGVGCEDKYRPTIKHGQECYPCAVDYHGVCERIETGKYILAPGWASCEFYNNNTCSDASQLSEGELIKAHYDTGVRCCEHMPEGGW